MKEYIYCKSFEKGKQSFYIVFEGTEYYLFSQEYRKSNKEVFGNKVFLSELRKLKKHHSHSVRNTVEKIPSHIRYIEKEYDIDCTFAKGKIGIDDSFSDIEYCAFSNVGHGTSDKAEYNSKKILANAYNERLSILNGEKSGITYSEKGAERIFDNGMMSLAKEGNRATYLMRQTISGKYNIALRVPSKMLGKKVGIRLNDGEVKEVTVPNNTPKVKNGDVYLNISTLDLNEGEYYFSLVNVGDEVSFYEIDFEPLYENPSYDFDLSSDFNNDGEFIVRNTLNFSNNAISTTVENDAFGFISRSKFYNPKASVSFKLTGSFDAIGFLGLLANVNNYNNNTQHEANPGYMEQGYMLKVEQDCIKLCYVDFNFITDIATYREGLRSNILYELSMEIENNHIVCYLDGEEIFDVCANIARLSGQVGVLAYRVESLISHFSAF